MTTSEVSIIRGYWSLKSTWAADYRKIIMSQVQIPASTQMLGFIGGVHVKRHWCRFLVEVESEVAPPNPDLKSND